MGCLFAIVWFLAGISEFVADLWHASRSRNDPPPPALRYPLPWCEPEHREWCGQFADCIYNCWQIPEEEHDARLAGGER